MKRIIIFFIFTFGLCQSSVASDINSIYHEVGAEEYISFNVFKDAYLASQKYGENKDIFGIIDYTKHINAERFFVINITEKRIVYKSITSHGQGSGNMYATKFSNKKGSYQTSLGVFLTVGYAKDFVENPKWLKYPNAIKLKGLSKGLNDNAWARGIVIHEASYTTPTPENFKKYSGRIGRSEGCPSLPVSKESEELMAYINKGITIYAYGVNKA